MILHTKTNNISYKCIKQYVYLCFLCICFRYAGVICFICIFKINITETIIFSVENVKCLVVSFKMQNRIKF